MMPAPLTREEIEDRLAKIRPLLYQGYTYKQIAEKVGLSETTVGNMVRAYGSNADRQKAYENWLKRVVRRGAEQCRTVNIGYGEQRLFEALVGRSEEHTS